MSYLFFTLSLLLSLIFSSTAYSVQQGGGVVATVNGVPITTQEFQQSYQQNQMFFSPRPVTKQKVLNDLINRQLGIQRGKQQKIDKNPVVITKLEDVIYHAQISKDLGPQLKKINVKESDIRKYYKKHREYRTAHILFRVGINATKEEDIEVLKKSISVYKTIESGPEKFSELANKYSESTTSVRGGDLGYQLAINLAPRYYAAIEGKENGHITPPVRTSFGYHIIKLLGEKKYKDIDSTQYKKLVYDQKRDTIIERHFAKLRKKAKIKIYNKNL